MTAEIAIVNRSAITLAADSAMTMSVGGRRKIYASTDKIFELSEKDPIGLMIYNNLEFMGAPIDVLIRQFRSSPHCDKFPSIKEAAQAFFDYLSSEWMASDDLQRRHAKQMLTPIYARIMSKLLRVTRDFRSRKKRPIDDLIELVSSEVAELESLPVAECFRDVPEEELRGYYDDLLDEVINKAFLKPPLGDTERTLCKRLGILWLHRDIFSDMLSGLVFAGFGSKEVFPSLLAFHTDGMIAGKLKTKVTDCVATSREQISAKVIPFAQREIVDRFMTGIDPDLEEGIKAYLQEAFEKTRNGILDGLGRVSAKTREKILGNLDASLGSAIGEFGPLWLEEVKKAFSKETEDMVLFMPKPEAAHLAEALVNITSLKRKFSPDEESVAGPIDVAVISRSDGFVWVKRKHYFPPELNQRYMVRKFGAPARANGGERS